jgi:hypothetical protein
VDGEFTFATAPLSWPRPRIEDQPLVESFIGATTDLAVITTDDANALRRACVSDDSGADCEPLAPESIGNAILADEAACSPSFADEAACLARCAGAGCDAATATCKDGTLDIECAGSCSPSNDATGDVACVGQCDAACVGSCIGAWTASSTCDGTCAGRCSGTCSPMGGSTTVRCDGRCAGGAEPISCHGRVELTCEVSVACAASCAARSAARSSCKAGRLTRANGADAVLDPVVAARVADVVRVFARSRLLPERAERLEAAINTAIDSGQLDLSRRAVRDCLDDVRATAATAAARSRENKAKAEAALARLGLVPR